LIPLPTASPFLRGTGLKPYIASFLSSPPLSRGAGGDLDSARVLETSVSPPLSREAGGDLDSARVSETSVQWITYQKALGGIKP